MNNRRDVSCYLEIIQNSVSDIKHHLSYGKSFEGGYILGELYNSIENKIKELDDYEIGDDEFDDEYCEEEEEEGLAELYEECKKNYEELWECHLESSQKVKDLRNILKDILRGKCDLIDLINRLSDICEEDTSEYLHSLVPSNTLLIKKH